MNSHASTVNSLFLAFYGRPAAPQGLNFWTQALEQAGGDVNAIMPSFANSEEARVRFGTDTAAERVTEIFQQLFGRKPKAEGLAFYVGEIESGKATIADVALKILNGAREADLTLINMRKQAADKFTAQVEASGSGYKGQAAIEAARLLVQSVKPAATTQDVDALISATRTLVDVATTSPEVTAALGDPEDLLTLVDGAAGTADPVTVVETLAETARSAKGDAQALAALVKGGGMNNILAALPEGTTIKDLVGKLGKGGLPAALKAIFPDGVPAAPAKPGKGGKKDGHGDEDGDDGDGIDDGADGDDAGGLDLSGQTGAQTVDYADLGQTDSSQVRGFETGVDKITFSGAAASAFDDNGDGVIQWAGVGGVEASTEAASASVDAAALGDGATIAATVAALNGTLQVGKVALNGDLLILAKGGSEAVLFQYVNKDGNGVIDAPELTEVAVFVEGAPAQADIGLVGTPTAPVVPTV